MVRILNVSVRAPEEAAVMVTTSDVSLASSIAVRVTVWGVDQLAVVKVIVVGTVTEDVVLDAKLTSASKGGWLVSTTEIVAVLPSLMDVGPVTEMASTSSSMAVMV
jgi:hypothetical protein